MLGKSKRWASLPVGVGFTVLGYLQESGLDAEGYRALRGAGEMSGVLRGAPGSEHLSGYESRLNIFFSRSRCLAICLYDLHAFDPELLLDVLASHPMVFIGSIVWAIPLKNLVF